MRVCRLFDFKDGVRRFLSEWPRATGCFRSFSETVADKGPITTTAKSDKADEGLSKRLNRLRWRSHQRGLLEMDILLGKWSETRLDQMPPDMLQSFEQFLDEETPLLYKWVTGQEAYPERLKHNPAFMDFYRFVQKRVEENSVEASRNRVHAEWVRGWHDRGNQ